MLYLLVTSGVSGVQLFALVLAFCLAVCIAMTAHEFAHARTAFSRGDETAKLAGRLTLNPVAHISVFGLFSFLLFGFGWAKPVPINPARFRNYKKDATWVLLSGVLTNLLLALLFSALWFFFSGSLIVSENVLLYFLGYFFYFCFEINLILAIFNLLPVPPLDGFNILALWTKYNNKFVAFLNQYGIFFLILFILPIFGGQSILGMLYGSFAKIFAMLWGLFV